MAGRPAFVPEFGVLPAAIESSNLAFTGLRLQPISSFEFVANEGATPLFAA